MPRAPPTHFLCLPLITPTSLPQLRESLARFRALLLTPPDNSWQSSDANGMPLKAMSVIPEAAYRPLGTLHLTLGVMRLHTQERLAAALDLLQKTALVDLLPESADTGVPDPKESPVLMAMEAGKPDAGLADLARLPASPNAASTPKPVVISLRGLAAFPEPKKASVLHAKPHDPSDRLDRFCLALRQVFIDAGYMEAERRPLSLHATVVNTVYAKMDRQNEKRRGWGKIAVDARGMCERFNGRQEGAGEGNGKKEEEMEFIWAEGVEMNRVTICKMGAKTVKDGGGILGEEYEVVAEKFILPT